MYYLGDEELAALKELFSKKKLFRYSAQNPTECDLFEKEFSEHIGVSHSLLLSSGTNALVAALLAAGINPGDEVLIPTYTFVATATAVLQVGAVPVLVNVDPQLSLSVKDAITKITDKTKAIIAVHMDGLAADINGISELAKKYGLILIEDSAQALGGSYLERRLGTIGHFGCFSLNENKIISCGEGGILVTSDRALFEKAFCIHDSSAQFNPSKKDFFTQIKPFLSHSMRVSEIQGTIMRVQLSRLEKILSELRQRKSIYVEKLFGNKNAAVVLGHAAEGDCSTSLHLQFQGSDQAAKATKKFQEAGFQFLPVTARPAHASWKWSHLLGKGKQYSTAFYLDSVSILTRTLKMDIPIHHTLQETEVLASQIQNIIAECI